MGEPVGEASGRTFNSDEHSPPQHLLEFTFGDVLTYP